MSHIPNDKQIKAFNNAVKAIKKLNDEYGLSTTKINVGGFPLAFTEMLAECVEYAIYEKYHDDNGKVSAMDGYFKIRRKFV